MTDCIIISPVPLISLPTWFRRNPAVIVVFGLIMPLAGVADHVLHFGNHFLGPKRLSVKAAVGGNVVDCRRQLSGYQDDLDRWPALTHRVGELQSIHAAGH